MANKPGHKGWVAPQIQHQNYASQLASNRGINSFSNVGPTGLVSQGVRDTMVVKPAIPGAPPGLTSGSASGLVRPGDPRWRVSGVAGGGQTTVAGQAGLQDAFTNALLGQINQKPLPDRNPEGMINNALGGLAENEAGAAAALQRNAAASGFGTGGGIQGGLQSLYQGFAGQKADTAQGIRNDMESLANQDRLAEEQRQLQALGIASQRITNQDQLALQQQIAQQAHLDRIAALNAARQAEQASQTDYLSMLKGMMGAGGGGGGGGGGSQQYGMPTPEWGGANMLGGGLGSATTFNPNKGDRWSGIRGSNAPANPFTLSFKR